MRPINTTESFDALKMKGDIQAVIYEETKGMSFQELDTYHRNRIESDPILSNLVRKFSEKASKANVSAMALRAKMLTELKPA